MHDFDLSNSLLCFFAFPIHYQIAHRNLFVHEFPQSWYVSTTIHILTNLVKAQPSSPTRYSPKPQDYNLLFPLLDDRPLEPLRICYRIESSPSFDSFSIPVESSSHIQNHIKLDQFRLRKALKPILDNDAKPCLYSFIAPHNCCSWPYPAKPKCKVPMHHLWKWHWPYLDRWNYFPYWIFAFGVGFLASCK